jgi:hypothetical protein
MFKISVPGDDKPQIVFPSLIGDLKNFVTFGMCMKNNGEEIFLFLNIHLNMG